MKYILAPMEGITGYLYRNAWQRHFAGAHCYMTPFLTPNKHHTFKTKEKADILPANNQGLQVIPQVLTKNAQDFLWVAGALEQLGYQEVNLNVGCPAATVVTKGKGAGLLADLCQLEHLLEDIFREAPIAVSVKTRIGMHSADEFAELLELYNQFPIRELTVHPRVRDDLYNNSASWEAFGYAMAHSTNPLCYNGDLTTAAQIGQLQQQFPTLQSVMLGRGLLRNPALLEEVAGQLQAPVLPRWMAFHEELLAGYQTLCSGEKPVLFKMKELWSYWTGSFAQGAAYARALQKAQRLSEYQALVQQIFAGGLR